VITDLLSPDAVRDPHAVYRRLREVAPVVWLPEHRAWFVGTYAEVHAGFRDPHLSSDRLTPLERRLPVDKLAILGETFELLRGWMVFHDPPHHERLKAPVRRAFTPKAVEGLRPFVERITADCVASMRARLADGEPVDIVADLAFPLPAIVIAELLGVPASDRDEFKTWSNQLATIVFGASSNPQQAERAAEGSARFAEYFRGLIAHYEARPTDNLISALIAAADLADPPLSPTELVGACTLLLFGGHETTTNLIGNAALALLDHPDDLRWLADHPESIGIAVEELHRFDGSSKLMVRIAADDHERGGEHISAGSTVFLGIAAANRDPAAFEQPDRLWLQRPDAAKHLGFGYGLHFCLGAPLARLESQVALAALAPLLVGVEAAYDGAVPWGATILGRGVSALPVVARPVGA
jgi:cytochrome P450